jgi:hypothetical protein
MEKANSGHARASASGIPPLHPTFAAMGKVIRCPECAKVYRGLDELEVLRDNDSICLVCNAPIEVPDWDRILASWEDEEDLDDIDDDLDDDWSHEEDEDLFEEEEDDEILRPGLAGGDDDVDVDVDEDEEEEEEPL